MGNMEERVDFHDRLEAVNARIVRACARAGRDPKSVTVVAVTKYVGVQEVKLLLDAGISHIAENRLQQALEKVVELRANATWHFIGHLQTNKVKDVLQYFDVIHSLDRMSLANEIDRRAAVVGKVVPCFMQVNISGEAAKGGCTPEDAASMYEQLLMVPNIQVRGLMTMAPLAKQPDDVRYVFRGLRDLRDRLADSFGTKGQLQELSMGMSHDFEVAVEEGATYVRLGSVLVK